MPRICLWQTHAANAMIVEVGFTGKCDQAILTFDSLRFRLFSQIRHLLCQMLSHTVGPTVPLCRRLELTVRKGAFKRIVQFRRLRMAEPHVRIQSMLLNKLLLTNSTRKIQQPLATFHVVVHSVLLLLDNPTVRTRVLVLGRIV